VWACTPKLDKNFKWIEEYLPHRKHYCHASIGIWVITGRSRAPYMVIYEYSHHSLYENQTIFIMLTRISHRSLFRTSTFQVTPFKASI
jgi:hypothetical protein